MDILYSFAGYVHYEYEHKSLDQRIAKLYGKTMSPQAARSWINKIKQLEEGHSKMQKGIDRALEREDWILFDMLIDKQSLLTDQLADLYLS